LLGRAARDFAILYLCCFAWAPAFVSAAAVTGEVYDVRTGAVVPGATVTLGGEKAVVGGDGMFRLVAVPRGPGNIVAKAPGYAVTVVPYLPVAPAPDEVWRNLPLMPLAAAAPSGGDFVDLFFTNAPLEEPYSGFISGRRIPDVPLKVKLGGVGEEGSDLVAAEVERLNERWGTALLEVTGEEALVRLDFNAATYSFRWDEASGARAAFRGGVTKENLALAEAFLRRFVLAAGRGAEVLHRETLAADAPLADDLDAVVEIIYRESPNFNYAIFRRRAPERFSLLTDFYLAIGGYEKQEHGVKDENGKPVGFPAEYQMGQIALALGGAYRNVWAKGGFWFAGIWAAGAEELSDFPRGPAEKVLRRNFSDYYRAGYWLVPLGGVRVGPFGGYRRFSVRGKYEGKDEAAALAPPLNVDYTTDYDGPEAGVSWDVAFNWYDLGLTGEYARVFAGEQFNVAETGIGVANRVGVGTFAFARFYWGRSFNYTFGGLAMKINVPL
jgi:hypothetical protein